MANLIKRNGRKVDYIVSNGKSGAGNGTASVNEPPSDLWQVRRLMLSRPKHSSTTEIVKHAVQHRKVTGMADPAMEWYIQVSVYSLDVVAFVGEVPLPEDGSNPQEELTRLIELAHNRAAFLNTNAVELSGDRIIYEN